MAVCLILSILIIVIFILSTKWKHRAARYICYATSATFLSTAVLPLIILLSKKVETFNIASRATYMLFVSCANNMLVCILSCSAFFLIVSAAMFLLYKKLYKKAVSWFRKVLRYPIVAKAIIGFLFAVLHWWGVENQTNFLRKWQNYKLWLSFSRATK